MYLQRVRRLLANKPGKDWKAVQKFMPAAFGGFCASVVLRNLLKG